MTDTPAEEVPAELARLLALAPPLDERPAPVRMNSWLCGLVHKHDYGDLADLRRITPPKRGSQSARRPVSQAALRAAAFAPEEELRVVYQQVAFLFARFHMGASRPHSGFGDMGQAVRRIGTSSGRGPKNTGAVRLLDRLTTSREVPWRFLQHAIERSRAGETAPPSWAQLVIDLSDWRSRTRDVPESWARSFYTPSYPAKKAGSE